MLPVLIQRALRDLHRGGSKKSALAKELRASPLLEATWTRCDLEANPPVNSARSTWAQYRNASAAEAILPDTIQAEVKSPPTAKVLNGFFVVISLEKPRKFCGNKS